MTLTSTPTVSIILPFYNARRWVHQSLVSLARQDLLDFELILIDDGSTDDSINVIRRIPNISFPIELIRHDTNKGIVASLNRGLDVARGRFIARMDADDVCLSRRLSTQLLFLKSGKADLCGSWFIEFGQGLRRTIRWPTGNDELKTAMLFQNTICHPTVMARREVFQRHRYRQEYLLAEDYDLFVRAMQEFRIANVPEPLLCYRRHAQQTTQSRRDTMEAITRRIRINALGHQGIDISSNEEHIHNLVRAPKSLQSEAELEDIEQWLLKLLDAVPDDSSRKVIASQWVRACVRAAPLGQAMWRRFISSPLLKASDAKGGTKLDLRLLALMKLDYASKPFHLLRRLGLST